MPTFVVTVPEPGTDNWIACLAFNEFEPPRATPGRLQPEERKVERGMFMRHALTVACTHAVEGTSGSGTPLCQGAALARVFRLVDGRRSVGCAGPGSG